MIKYTYKESKEIIKYAYKPLEVFTFCKDCDNYNLQFSCPNHSFSLEEYILTYPYVLIFYSTINSYNKNTFELFLNHKKELDSLLYSLEKNNIRAIIPGICSRCSLDCYKYYDSCINPTLIRYSFESLGIYVDKLIKYSFNENLLFSSKNVSFVFGFQLNEKDDTIIDKVIKFYDKYK